MRTRSLLLTEKKDHQTAEASFSGVGLRVSGPKDLYFFLIVTDNVNVDKRRLSVCGKCAI